MLMFIRMLIYSIACHVQLLYMTQGKYFVFCNCLSLCQFTEMVIYFPGLVYLGLLTV